MFYFVTVSSGSLVKQSIADETKAGQAAKAYIEKSMMGKVSESVRHKHTSVLIMFFYMNLMPSHVAHMDPNVVHS